MKKIAASLLVVLLCNGLIAQTHDLTQNLVLRLNFDSNLTDLSGSGLSVISYANPPFVNDRNGNSNSAIHFDGTYQSLRIDDEANSPLDFSGDFTVAAWVKKLSNSNNWDNTSGVGKWKTGAAAGQNEWSLGIGGNNGSNSNTPGFTIEIGNTYYNAKSTKDLVVGEWNHLVGVRDGTLLKFYLNGSLESTITVPAGPINNVDRDFRVARIHSGTAQSHSHVEFDDILAWDKALSDSEISGLMNYGVTTGQQTATLPIPIGYWPLNGDANDSIGNMNGTIIGATLTSDRNSNANKAYSFDGVDDQIELNNSTSDLSFIHKTAVFTISMFVKINDLNRRQGLLVSSYTSANRGFSLYWDTYGGTFGNHQLRFSMAPDPSLGTWHTLGAVNSITDNDWHHIAVVGNGTNIQFYVDGQIDGSATTIGSLGTLDADLNATLGGTYVGELLGGAMDNAQIYNLALTSAEITQLSNGVEPGTVTGNSGGSLWSEASSANIYYNQGKVGIGTNEPDQLLHVKSSQSDVSIQVETTGNNVAGIELKTDSNSDWQIAAGGSAAARQNDFYVYDRGSNLSRLLIDENGNVGIGTDNPGNKLEVNGTIRTKKVKVEATNWPDYVFAESYKLQTLSEVEAFIQKNQHLPEVPSVKEVGREGLDLGAMDATLLKKVEELTLYLIEQNKNSKLQTESLKTVLARLDKLETQNSELKAQNLKLQQEIESIKKEK